MRLEVDSDPHAEGFYRAMGMRRTGQASSGSIAGRMLPHLTKELAPAAAGTERSRVVTFTASDGPPVPR